MVSGVLANTGVKLCTAKGCSVSTNNGGMIDLVWWITGVPKTRAARSKGKPFNGWIGVARGFNTQGHAVVKRLQTRKKHFRNAGMSHCWSYSYEGMSHCWSYSYECITASKLLLIFIYNTHVCMEV